MQGYVRLNDPRNTTEYRNLNQAKRVAHSRATEDDATYYCIRHTYGPSEWWTVEPRCNHVQHWYISYGTDEYPPL